MPICIYFLMYSCSESVVFVGSKSSQISTRAIGIKSELCQSILTRSQSVPLKEGKEVIQHFINSFDECNF